MQALMFERRDPALTAYFVWGPYLRADTEAAAREAARRFVAPNCSHYYTPDTGFSHRLGSVLRMPGGRVAWDVYLLYGRLTLWDRSIPRPAYWQHQLDVLQGDVYSVPKLDEMIRKELGSA